MKNNFEQKLMKMAKEAGIEIKEDNAILHGIFKKEIEKWNEKVNLTSIKEEEEFIVKHVLDSLMLLKKMDIPCGTRIIDVGTGAGFPGIPLKIERKDLSVYLLDSNRKKTDFLESTIKKLGLKETNVLCARAETIGRNPKYRESFDFAVARAVSALNVLSEFCLPLVKMGGFFVALKGKDPEEEIEEAEDAIKTLGGRINDALYYELPGGIQRSMVIVEKVIKTPETYPRREGMPEKRPILLKKFPKKEGD
ncbi:MAG: rRNA (guanine527-N7)-methyltransferase [Tepidanaerobacteraceae bacterium]|nr:rRNA (guanine527-N7)-methyltransferase [Tepidanaerobacteraceae bacterium]